MNKLNKNNKIICVIRGQIGINLLVNFLSGGRCPLILLFVNKMLDTRNSNLYTLCMWYIYTKCEGKKLND